MSIFHSHQRVVEREGVVMAWQARRTRRRVIFTVLPVGGLAILSLLASCVSLTGAARQGDVETVRALLAEGEDPNGRPSHVPPIFEAIDRGDLALVKILVEAGADVDRVREVEHLAAPSGSTAQVTPLEQAAILRRADIVRYLLSVGAIVPADTLALMAVQTRATDFARVTDTILQHIAEVHGEDDKRRFINNPTWHNCSPLAAAALYGDHRMVVQLLEHGADPNARCSVAGLVPYLDDAWPPLYLARYKGRERAVKLLLDGGADPNLLSGHGQTYEEALAQMRRREEDKVRQRIDEERRRAAEQEERQRQSEALFATVVSGVAQGYEAAMADRTEQETQLRALQQVTQVAPSSSGVDSSNPPVAISDGSGMDSHPEWQADQQRLAQQRAEREAKIAREREAQEREQERLAREKAEREAKVAAEKTAQKQLADYLATMRQGIRLEAITCPGGGGQYFVSGTKPQANGDYCIDVVYRAECPGNVAASTGVASIFVGSPGCFGDTYRIAPKPPCEVEQVVVHVTDVRTCR